MIGGVGRKRDLETGRGNDDKRVYGNARVDTEWRIISGGLSEEGPIVDKMQWNGDWKELIHLRNKSFAFCRKIFIARTSIELRNIYNHDL